MKKKEYPIVNIGSASMLVIFIILSLVTFATLSLSSAIGDYKFSKKIADRTADYYNASNQAEETLMSIDSKLKNTYETAPANYDSNLTKVLKKVDGLELYSTDGLPTISYLVPMNGSQQLYVELELGNPNKASGHFYDITAWQVVSTKNWQGDDKLKLMD